MNRRSHCRPLIKPLVATVLLGLALAQPAFAGVSGPWTRSSKVSDTVTNNGNGSWSYGYTVNNTSFVDTNSQDFRVPYIVDWELPYFSDAGISNIRSPFNWGYNIETIGVANAATGWDGVAAWQTPGDPFYAGAGSPFTKATQVLHWYNLCWAGRPVNTSIASFSAVVRACEWELQDAIAPDLSLDGFGFDALFDRADAPYQASWAALPVRTGDPAFPLGGLPNSPATRGGQTVPEPGMLALFGIGLLGVLARRRRL